MTEQPDENPPETEYSASGSPIYHHAPNENFEPAPASPDADLIEAHIARYVGKIDRVFHELASNFVHIDVHIIPPTTERPYYTLVTSGMSDKPMNVPVGAEDYRYAELMLCVPSEWKLEQADLQDEQHYWVVRWLKILARLPHQYNTWLGVFHSIPNGDPPRPFAPNTKLSGIMLARPFLFEDEFWELALRPDKTIHFYSLLPLYPEEMQYKLQHGGQPLLDLLMEEEITELLDIRRVNVAFE
jgi:hypothetical protein